LKKKKVLFICIHNSSRSQIAEELVNKYASDILEAKSAGYNPTSINPIVADVLEKEEQIDIRHNSLDNIFKLCENCKDKNFDYVISVCNLERVGVSPLFPGTAHKIEWDFADPSKFVGEYEYKYQKIYELYKDIKKEVFKFIELVRAS